MGFTAIRLDDIADRISELNFKTTDVVSIHATGGGKVAHVSKEKVVFDIGDDDEDNDDVDGNNSDEIFDDEAEGKKKTDEEEKLETTFDAIEEIPKISTSPPLLKCSLKKSSSKESPKPPPRKETPPRPHPHSIHAGDDELQYSHIKPSDDPAFTVLKNEYFDAIPAKFQEEVDL
ncbi:hypothetical protein L2E82_10009 [Cichorium intybus]|uniref:Uncharacterized protein n=1 Tax=Cichorium intybus TaxID=13427 RepID=A0ACB9G9N0_CICIN|nr:hypothetical protein L2E82_10009 [Cichorium intybus]